MTADNLTSRWDEAGNTLTTRISGPAGLHEVETWRDGLYRAAGTIPAGSRFKMLIDIRGYEVADIEPAVHKIQRLVIPTFLAEHNYRTAFFDLFPEAPDPEVEKRDSSCIAVAHIHHDCNKMDLYRTNLGRTQEQFFCIAEDAWQWLSGL